MVNGLNIFSKSLNADLNQSTINFILVKSQDSKLQHVQFHKPISKDIIIIEKPFITESFKAKISKKNLFSFKSKKDAAMKIFIVLYVVVTCVFCPMFNFSAIVNFFMFK